MTAIVDICNIALQHIGTRSSIQSLTENSTESNVLALRYDSVRKQLLRSVHWNFARKQGFLSLLIDGTLGTTPIPPQPWLYEYAPPADCVQMRYIMPQFQNTAQAALPGVVTMPTYLGPPVRFLIAQDQDILGNPISVVLTNQQSAIGVYTADVQNTSMFDPSFIEAFALALGAAVCRALTGDSGRAQQCKKDAEELIARARSDNGNEGLTIIDHIPDWMRVRGYAGDWAYPDGGMYLYGPQSLTLVT